jgi:hypothetical protein
MTHDTSDVSAMREKSGPETARHGSSTASD